MDTETIGEDDWNELQKNLEATIPVYDKINGFATLGQVSKWRRKVRERLPEEGLILEVGCGPGSFACLLYTSPSPRDQRGSRMPSSA